MKPFCTIAAIGLSLIALAGAYSQPYSGPGSGSGYGRDYTGPGSGVRDRDGAGLYRSGVRDRDGRCRTIIQRSWRNGERVTIRRRVCG
jgi:hypothetical protein